MMQKNTTILVFFLTFLIFISGIERAAAQQGPDQFRLYLKQGIEKAFNLEPWSANAYLQKAVEMDPENPLGYAFLALVHLFAYEMSFEAKEREYYQQSVLYYVQETLARGENIIKNSVPQGDAYLSMALAKIVKVRWAIMRNEYLTVAKETSNIWNYLEKAKDKAHNYDIYFPMGLLHYHIDHLPGVSRILSSMVITPGDRTRGLQELELAAQNGDLLKDVARSELVAAYANFEKQPAKALPIVRELKGKFPRNFNFTFSLANILSDLHHYEEAFAVAREIEKNIQSGKDPYGPHLKSRYYLLMGRIFFSRMEYDKAVEYCQKTLSDTSPYNARVRAGAFVRLGMIHDARKEREHAEECYNNALMVGGGEGAAQVEARKYLKIPYVPESKP
jgi:tetratricopeptide (TPR) repeat protein